MNDREELIKIAIFLMGILIGSYILSGPLTMALQLLFLIPYVALTLALVLAINPLVWAILFIAYLIKRM